MSRKIISLIALIIASFLIICNIVALAQFSDERPMAPILDSSVDPSLSLDECFGGEQETTGYFTHPSDVAKLKKKLKTKQCTYVREVWHGRGIITINRWELKCPEDAIIFPETNIPVPSGFPGWHKVSDIGDKTCWLGSDIVIFAKKNYVIRVSVNPSTIGKDYTKKLAQSIANKL